MSRHSATAGLTRGIFRPFDAAETPGTDTLHPPYGRAESFDRSAVQPEPQVAAQTDPTLDRYARRANQRDLGIDGDIQSTAARAEPPTAGIHVTPTANTKPIGDFDDSPIPPDDAQSAVAYVRN